MMRSAIAPLVLAIVLATGGCGDEKEAAPVIAARHFADVVLGGDAKALVGLIDVEAAARLERAATRASDQVGGRRSIEMYEMLQIVDVPYSLQIAKAELVGGDDQQAQVALTAADGTQHILHMVFQEGSWRVRVPTPGPATADESS
ncbi:MAG: hypothetical protein JNK45_10200 [Myxococcales bacterium]|nr:hypothetical protein [Myxococcales bacterium]